MEGKDLQVRLRVTLDKEGSVMKIQIHDPEGRYRSDDDFHAVADYAMHALRECSPYITLPPEKYAAWRQTAIDFDPSGFFIPAKQ